jgi:hypothetical protein
MSIVGRLCECGCGQPARRRFVRGHHTRKSPVEYIEQDCGYETPCWVWQRSTTPGGYGKIKKDGLVQSAHRVYYERENGPIAPGMDLDHKCRVRHCVNPAHLEEVTRAENLRRGTRTRLTVDVVREIRERYAAGGVRQIDLAEYYGVSPTTIGSVVTRYSWKDVA